MFAHPEAEARAADTAQLEASIAEVMGIINVAHGRLAALVTEIAEVDGWSGPGLATLGQWVAWKTGLSPARARDLVHLTERADELPAAAAALAEGSLTLDQVTEIVRHVPTGYDESVTAFAKSATVAQLHRSLPNYGWTPRSRPEGPDRFVSHGADDRGWWLRARLGTDEGAVVAKALDAHRDDLYQQLLAELPEGAPKPQVSLADGLVSLAETGLAAGEARFPGSDRYLVHAHLEAGPRPGEADVLSLHLGPVVPADVRRLLTCDASFIPVLERDGVPVSVGRRLRTVNRALRRLIEHRDGGCVVPGCGTRLGLRVHHIVHWEDGGSSDTNNLCCLCHRHHQLHHHGLLPVLGNPDLPPGAPGALEVQDRHGRPLHPSGRPTSPASGASVHQAACAVGLRPVRYTPPCGERLDRGAVYFAPNAAPQVADSDGTAAAAHDRPPPGPVARPTSDHEPTRITASRIRPTRAGPVLRP